MKPETLKIEDIKISDHKKDNSECIDKNGNPFWIVGIKTEAHGWLNCNYFPFNPTDWKGTEQSVVVYEEEYLGKTSKKFKLPFKGGKAAPKHVSTPPAGVPSYSEDKLLRELRALNVKADKTYEVLCDLMKKLLKKGVIELEVPFPTDDDINNYGK